MDFGGYSLSIQQRALPRQFCRLHPVPRHGIGDELASRLLGQHGYVLQPKDSRWGDTFSEVLESQCSTWPG